MATKRNAIGVLMGVELVLNGATINFVAFAHFNPAFEIEGQIFALFVIVLAAAEAAVALAIVLNFYNNHTDRGRRYGGGAEGLDHAADFREHTRLTASSSPRCCRWPRSC